MSYLADVQMPVKEEVNLDQIAGDRSEEENPNFEYEEEEVEEEEEELMPVVESRPVKEKIGASDIFKAKAPPKKKVKIVDKVEVMREAIVPKIAPVKAKRKMSEKQLEALARGRANRAKKKAPAPPAPEPAPAPAPYQPDPVSVAYKEKKMNEDYQKQMYSKEDLQEMVFQGVQKYDLQRKKRKAQKQKLTAKATHEKKVFSDINNALERTVPTSDPWANCFT
tara:strand:+ start:114 stop:782 length:669 start_codon:yes stop_codon:yes gene_type:complete